MSAYFWLPCYIIDAKGQTIYAGAIDDKPTANPADVKTAKNFVRTAMGEAARRQARQHREHHALRLHREILNGRP